MTFIERYLLVCKRENRKQKMAEGANRVILIAMDGSKHSEYAFQCKKNIVLFFIHFRHL